MARLKKALLATGAGVLAAGIALGATIGANNDLRVLFGVAFLLIGVAAFAVRRFTPLVLLAPVLMYALVIHRELPVTWPMTAFWAAACAAGAMLVRRRMPGIAMLAPVILFAAWYGFRGLPRAISGALTKYTDVPAPEFVLETLDGKSVTSASLKGKVVVLDFFNTWCVPCRAELPEMAKVRDAFAADPRVVFLVAADESGGDTPDAVRQYAASLGHNLDFVMDRGGKAHEAMAARGVPALVVIDQNWRIRLRRRGYNASETAFAEVLVDFIRTTVALLPAGGEKGHHYPLTAR
jgi:thiol-disulfide isomerase/thioredoxin